MCPAVLAKGKFHAWDTKVTNQIEAIRQTKRGEGVDLDFNQATALAGEWYSWFIAKYENNPGDPVAYDRALWDLGGGHARLRAR